MCASNAFAATQRYDTLPQFHGLSIARRFALQEADLSRG
jgi:hypothetical protein